MGDDVVVRVEGERREKNSVWLMACSKDALSNNHHYIWEFGDGSDTKVIDRNGMLVSHTFKKTGML